MNKELELSAYIEEISMGPFGSDIKVDNFIETGVPVLNGSNLSSFKLSESSFKYVSEKKATTFKKAIARRGDIVITHRGTLGQISYIPEDSVYDKYVISQSQFRVRFKDEYVNPAYLVYLFHSEYGQKKLLSFKNHVGVPALAQATTNFRKLKISLPDLAVQNQIAVVLSSLDDKIELNNKINMELEEMAKTLYDYWFVQFDFPDKKGRPYRSSGGEMVYNTVLKREIPKEWVNRNLLGWIKIDKSGDWGRESNEGNYQLEVACIRGADINGLNGKGDVKAPRRFILEKNYRKILESHDLIVEISGGSPTQSTGRLSFVTESTFERFNVPLICSNFCKAVSLKDKKYLFNFAYAWNSAYENGILFGYEGKTSGIKNLLFDSFVSSYQSVFPKIEVIEKFYDFMIPLHNQKQNLIKQNLELTRLRDWLLPMLMNGQVKVVCSNKGTELTSKTGTEDTKCGNNQIKME